MAFLGPNNALAWAHYRLRGGWKRTLTFTISATIVLVLLIVGTTESNPFARSRMLYSWTTGLLAFQAFILALYVMGRINGAVRGDIQSKIIESHRLMPTAGTEAIAGYISGAAMQPLVFCAAIFIVGIFTAGGAGIDINRWAFAHVMLLAFAMFLWTAAAYASFGAKFGAAAIFVPIFFGPSATGSGGLSALPGLMVMLNPIIGDSIFDMRTRGFELPPTYAMALAVQFYFGAIFFLAAVRRYRSADGIGIDTVLGLLLVAGWMAVSWVGLRWWDYYAPRAWRLMEVENNVKVVASLIAGLLIALAAVSASAWAHARWRRHQLMQDPAPLRRPMPAMLVIAIATILLLIIPYARPLGGPPQWSDVGKTALIIIIALTAIYVLCAWVYHGYPRAIIVGMIWIVLMWGVPVVADLIRYGLADMGETQPIAGIATGSPVGALIAIWGKLQGVDVRPGILLQFLIMCIPLVLRLMQVMHTRAAIRKAL